MLTACEICVCATYTGATGTSRAAVVITVTSTGGLATSVLLSLPHPVTRETAMIDGAAMRQSARAVTETMGKGIGKTPGEKRRPRLPPARRPRIFTPGRALVDSASTLRADRPQTCVAGRN